MEEWTINRFSLGRYTEFVKITENFLQSENQVIGDDRSGIRLITSYY